MMLSIHDTIFAMTLALFIGYIGVAAVELHVAGPVPPATIIVAEAPIVVSAQDAPKPSGVIDPADVGDTMAALSYPTSEPLHGRSEATSTAFAQTEGSEQTLYTVEEFYAVIARTPWPDSLWYDVWLIASCESVVSVTDPATERLRISATAIGDTHFATTGPSHGGLQINIAEWPLLLRSFDLLDLHDNLVAGYILFLEVGRSFHPWTCATALEGN